jgi:hypothetical protein
MWCLTGAGKKTGALGHVEAGYTSRQCCQLMLISSQNNILALHETESSLRYPLNQRNWR